MTHVLLVEDNPVDARLMQRMFQEETDWPTQITWLDDGQKALQYLHSLERGRVREAPVPALLDLVLLDLNLPRYDGLQVLAAFRNSPAASNLPIFLLSSSPAENTAALAETNHLRADDCFEKPLGWYGFQDIAARIRTCCGKPPRNGATLEARKADALERMRLARH